MRGHGMGSYDYIVVGGGAAGSVVAGELSKTGADVLLVEAGGSDSVPTVGNPSIWFYNVGGALDLPRFFSDSLVWQDPLPITSHRPARALITAVRGNFCSESTSVVDSVRCMGFGVKTI